MSFDWAQYVNVARELVGEKTSPSSEEAKARAAISRAYYAAFNKARWYLRYKDYDRNIPQDGAAHEYIKTRFRTHPDAQYKTVGTTLNQLSIERKKADYNDNFPNAADQAKSSIKAAATIISILDSL